MYSVSCRVGTHTWHDSVTDSLFSAFDSAAKIMGRNDVDARVQIVDMDTDAIVRCYQSLLEVNADIAEEYRSMTAKEHKSLINSLARQQMYLARIINATPSDTIYPNEYLSNLYSQYAAITQELADAKTAFATHLDKQDARTRARSTAQHSA